MASHPIKAAVGLLALLAGCGANLVLHTTVRDFDARVTLFLGGSSNSTLFTHGRDEALLVDVKSGGDARRLHADVVPKVRRILLTHAHGDHTGGLSLWRGSDVVMVHPKARERLTVDAPFVEVTNEVRLMLGGEEVRILDMGSGHTNGDLVALIPGRKLLIAGDLVNQGLEPYADERYGGDLLQMAKTVPRLMQLDFDFVVPGHGGLMPRVEVQRLADYFIALEAAVRSARASGKTEDEAAAQVTLPEHPLLETLFITTRKGNVRKLYRALARELH